MSNRTITEPDLSETLKHCSADTLEAAQRFRRTGDPSDLTVIIPGMIERHVSQEHCSQLHGSWDDLRLAEDLGVDSLALMEIALQAEDVFQVSFADRELRALRTVGAFRRLVMLKLDRHLASAGSEQTAPDGASWAAGDANIAAMPEGSSS